jgi:hypothetical protein
LGGPVSDAEHQREQRRVSLLDHKQRRVEKRLAVVDAIAAADDVVGVAHNVPRLGLDDQDNFGALSERFIQKRRIKKKAVKFF